MKLNGPDVKNNPKSYFLPQAGVFLFFIILYGLTLSNVISLTHDSMSYIRIIETMRPDFHPHHLLYHALTLYWYKLCLFLGLPMSPAHEMALLNSVAGAFSLAALWRLMKVSLGSSSAAAYSTVAAVGFSFGFWFYSVNVEVYIFPILFFLLTLLSYFSKRNSRGNLYLTLGLAAGTVLFHQIYAIFYLIVGASALFKYKEIKAVEKLGAIVLVGFAVVGLPYLAVMYAQGARTLPEMARWMTQYGQESKWWNDFNIFILPKSLVGFSRTFVSAFGAFRIDQVLEALARYFPGNDLDNEIFFLRNYPKSAIYLYAALAAGFVSLLAYGFIRARKALFALVKNGRLALPVAAFLAYSVFFMFWDSLNVEFWILQSIIFWVVFFSALSESRANLIKFIGTGVAVLLFSLNFFFATLPAKDINNDFYYVKARATLDISPRPRYAVVWEKWLLKEFFDVYAPEVKPVNAAEFPAMRAAGTLSDEFVFDRRAAADIFGQSEADSARFYVKEGIEWLRLP